jgi:hypothetical protein
MCHQVCESFTNKFSHNKHLIWEIDKNMMNILGIAMMLISRYGGHIGKLWYFWELDA